MENRLAKELGFRIKDLREREGVSQVTFAHRIGMDRSYFASIEAGHRNVSLNNLAKIAEGFDMSIAELFVAVPRIRPEDWQD